MQIVERTELIPIRHGGGLGQRRWTTVLDSMFSSWVITAAGCDEEDGRQLKINRTHMEMSRIGFLCNFHVHYSCRRFTFCVAQRGLFQINQISEKKLTRLIFFTGLTKRSQ